MGSPSKRIIMIRSLRIIVGLLPLITFNFVMSNQAEITKFHVNAKVQMRYAITNIETKVKNIHNETSNVHFNMYIPKEAFVSNFSMVIKDKAYVAKVDTKENALKIFENSTTTSGIVQSFNDPKFKDGKHVTFTAKLEPADKVTFHLRYEELLQRSEKGQYNYELNLQPENQVIDDFKITIQINESLPLRDISVKRFLNQNEIKFQAQTMTQEVLTFDEKNAPHQATIEMVPSPDQNKGEDWKLVLNYDVKRPQDGNDIQIGAGKFVHYFAPDKLPTIAKHIVFVIDVSGSMSGSKMSQAKDAMTTILDKMSQEKLDNFNIIKFSSYVTGQYPTNGSYSIPEFDGNVNLAYNFILDMIASGGTNINDALLEALEICENVKISEEIDSKTEQMIIFLSDGEASSGVTDSDQIRENVREANKDLQVPIYGLAFGSGADFDLIKDVSDETNGFAQRIYDSGNSFEQLEDFYNQISDPKLKNVNFEYMVNGEKLERQNLTSTNIKRIFGAHEYSIVGEFDTLQEINEVQIIMKAEDTTGNIEKMISLKPCPPDIALPAVENRVDQETIEIENRTSEYAVDFDLLETRRRCLPMPNLLPNQIPNSGWVYSPSEEFMSRLWAFKRINYLLKEDKTANNSNEAEAIKLALEYNFVTDVTSMVVEESDEYVKKGTLIPIPKPLNNFNLDQMSVQHRSMPGPSFPSSRRGRVGGSRGSSRSSSRGRSGAVSRRGYSSRSSSGTTSSYIIGGSRSSSRSNSTSSYSRQGRISYKTASLPRQSFDMSAPQFASMAVDASHQSGPVPSLEHSIIGSSAQSMLTPQQSVPCQLTMYAMNHFRGDSINLTESAPDLGNTTLLPMNFDNKVASVKITVNCCWKLYNDSRFNQMPHLTNPGFMHLRPGDYPSVTDIRAVFKKASSAEKVNC